MSKVASKVLKDRSIKDSFFHNFVKKCVQLLLIGASETFKEKTFTQIHLQISLQIRRNYPHTRVLRIRMKNFQYIWKLCHFCSKCCRIFEVRRCLYLLLSRVAQTKKITPVRPFKQNDWEIDAISASRTLIYAVEFLLSYR